MTIAQSVHNLSELMGQLSPPPICYDFNFFLEQAVRRWRRLLAAM